MRATFSGSGGRGFAGVVFVGLVLAVVPRGARADDIPPTAGPPDTGSRLERSSTVPVVPIPEDTGASVYRAAPVDRVIPAPESPWRFQVAGYGWYPQVIGTAWSDGVSTKVDVPFSKVADHLRYVGEGYAEVGYGRWSLAVDATFVGLKDDLVVQKVPVAYKLGARWIDLRLGANVLCRRLGTDRWDCFCRPRFLRVDALVGARAWHLEQTFAATIPFGAAAPALSHTSTTTWWDPYVGLRLRADPEKRWFVELEADVGGFSIGDASSITWQLEIQGGYRITRALFVSAGYRLLDVKRVHGSGTGKAGLDATFQGPVVGLGLRF